MGQQMAIRMGDWKLVKGLGSKGVLGFAVPDKASTDGAELYNLKADLGEKNNLADQEPAKFKELVPWSPRSRDLLRLATTVCRKKSV